MRDSVRTNPTDDLLLYARPTPESDGLSRLRAGTLRGPAPRRREGSRIGPKSLAAAIVLSLLLSLNTDQLSVVAAEPDTSLAEAIRFRTEVGFRADVSFVDATLRDPAYSNGDYGVPLSETEAAEVARRMGVQRVLIPAETHASQSPGYAGSWMDQSRGGTPVFAFVGNTQSRASELAQLVPRSVSFDVVNVDRTRADLAALRDSIFEERGLLTSAGIDVVSAGLHPPTNAVVVGVSGSAAEAQSVLAARYGPGVRAETLGAAELDACNGRHDCLPLKGGIKMYRASVYKCTSGFLGKVSGAVRMITAGHCIGANGGSGASWQHPAGTTFGQAVAYIWYNNAPADVGTISITNPPTTKNQFYATGKGDIDSVTGYYPLSSQNVGDLLCRSGGTTGWKCGDIDIEDETRVVVGYNIHNQWVVSFDADQGDSGAPLVDQNATYFAYGTHSSSTSGYNPSNPAWYTPLPVSFVEYGGLALCVDAGCTS